MSTGCVGRGEIVCPQCNADQEHGFYKENQLTPCPTCYGRGLIAHKDGSDTMCVIWICFFFSMNNFKICMYHKLDRKRLTAVKLSFVFWRKRKCIVPSFDFDICLSLSLLYSCGKCNGKGKTYCSTCGSHGLVKCETCKGRGSLKTHNVAIVKWYVTSS